MIRCKVTMLKSRKTIFICFFVCLLFQFLNYLVLSYSFPSSLEVMIVVSGANRPLQAACVQLARTVVGRRILRCRSERSTNTMDLLGQETTPRFNTERYLVENVRWDVLEETGVAWS